jgi:hypothetical protein
MLPTAPAVHKARRSKISRRIGGARRCCATSKLKDPAAARAGDERLKELAQRYHPLAMPAFDGLNRVALETLVDSLLTP